MSEVKHFQHIAELCQSTDELMRLYPMATQYVLASDYDHLEAENKALQEELEIERMRLAACGVVALANTPESAAEAREMHPDYWSASCGDVAQAIDREMQLRAELEALRSRVVVVPGRTLAKAEYSDDVLIAMGWNACLDKLARLNGKTVSEGLLRRAADLLDADGRIDTAAELRALLDAWKEEGNGQ